MCLIQTEEAPKPLRHEILSGPDLAATREVCARAVGLQPTFPHESGDFGEMHTEALTLCFAAMARMKGIGKPAAKPPPLRVKSNH